MQLFHNIQASRQGPSRIRLQVLSKASRSHSHRPLRADCLPSCLEQHRTANCPAGIYWGKHHLPHPDPSHAFPTTFCTSEIQPFAAHTLPQQAQNSGSPIRWLCTPGYPAVAIITTVSHVQSGSDVNSS